MCPNTTIQLMPVERSICFERHHKKKPWCGHGPQQGMHACLNPCTAWRRTPKPMLANHARHRATVTALTGKLCNINRLACTAQRRRHLTARGAFISMPLLPGTRLNACAITMQPPFPCITHPGSFKAPAQDVPHSTCRLMFPQAEPSLLGHTGVPGLTGPQHCPGPGVQAPQSCYSPSLSLPRCQGTAASGAAALLHQQLLLLLRLALC